MTGICHFLGVLSISAIYQGWICAHSCLYPCIMNDINSCNDWVDYSTEATAGRPGNEAFGRARFRIVRHDSEIESLTLPTMPRCVSLAL
ncbi:hypothetical protein IW261DRAFT_1534395 [Armillaria novae-zelandiae]|uniref:Secreted protein n=1 Tax=Armillaria novae-zelandiae TaxID=153914 RepID=A0AA39N727_9AGAR|nr:hypothetical protein IW261DRAFT_1534395 [Armillaria novae-zelandiae]